MAFLGVMRRAALQAVGGEMGGWVGGRGAVLGKDLAGCLLLRCITAPRVAAAPQMMAQPCLPPTPGTSRRGRAIPRTRPGREDRELCPGQSGHW